MLTHLKGVRRSGDGFMARCPHHDDRQASLSIREGKEGRVLLHCFAGCPNLSVVESAGLAMVDLFQRGSRERLKPRMWKGAIPMNAAGRPSLGCWGDDQVADLLGEVARLAKVRGTLDKPVATALKAIAAAVGVSPERLTEAARAALETVEPA